jgi:hypothetical protein
MYALEGGPGQTSTWSTFKRQAVPVCSEQQSADMEARHEHDVVEFRFLPGRAQYLADELQLPLQALDCLEIGYRQFMDYPSPFVKRLLPAYLFKECNAKGRMVGVGLRFRAKDLDEIADPFMLGRPKNKIALQGGFRGLTLPLGWRDLPDPVVIVEGPSDCLAGRWANLNCVGRPSCSGGADMLIELLRERQVVIMAENDAREKDGRIEWPGRDGAESIKKRLEYAWQRDVPIVYPPVAFKDLREQVIDLLKQGARNA